MGCQCLLSKTSYELLVDDLLQNIPIRQMPLEYIITIIEQHTIQKEKKYTIHDTAFQRMFNIYCSNSDKLVYFKDYWSRVLNYSIKRKTISLVFTICLLSKYENNKETHSRIYEVFQKYFDSGTDNLVILGTELADILIKYICNISYLVVEPFETLSPQQHDFSTYLRKAWHPDKIYRFVGKQFFKGTKNMSASVDLRKFLQLNLDLLMNDALLRNKLANYVLKIEDVY